MSEQSSLIFYLYRLFRWIILCPHILLNVLIEIFLSDKFQLFNKKISNETLFAKLKGEEGSKVELTIYRKATNKKFKVTVSRDVVPIKSVDIATLIDDKTGYIKVNRFAETTYHEFHKAILKLKNIGATELIIDLRDNGGGYLEIATEMVDEFLKEKAYTLSWVLHTKSCQMLKEKIKGGEDPLICIKDVFPKFRIKPWSWLDIPYFSMLLNIENEYHLKINFKWSPLPIIFDELRKDEKIWEKFQNITNKNELAMFIIEQFWFACNNLEKKWKAPFKVMVSKYLTKNN